MELKLSWQDKQGNKHSRIYKDQREAYKAKQWLVDNGAVDIDIAIVKKSATIKS